MDTVQFSLKHFGSQIGLKGLRSEWEEQQINQIVKELKNGDFSNLETFEKIVDDLLNNVLENIKSYAESDEAQKIDILNNLIQKTFQEHIFDFLGDSSIKEIKEEFSRELSTMIKNLRSEGNYDSMISKDRKPLHWFFKRFVETEVELSHDSVHEARVEIQLEDEEDKIHKELDELIKLLTKPETKLPEKDQGEYRALLKKKLMHFAEILLEEYHALFEAEIDSEIQESDLIDDINSIIKKVKGNTAVRERLIAIKTKIESHCHDDFVRAKNMIDKAENIEGKLK